ncbi:MAG: ComEC/Rec2 family competence protein [Spirochaetales bacterium]|nr:ComEC/Rec2 family competence protein [Spirochaetales bacterium]
MIQKLAGALIARLKNHIFLQPVFPLAVAAVGGVVLLLLDTTLVSFVGVMAAFPLAGCGLALFFLTPEKTKSRAFLFLAFSAGLFVGGVQQLGLELKKQTSYIPIKLRTVEEVGIILDDDSYRLENGNTVYRGSLFEVSSRGRSMTVTAQGAILVFVKNGHAAFWGERLRIVCVPRRASGQADILYTASARQDAVYIEGFASPLAEFRKTLLAAVIHQTEMLGTDAAGFFKALFLGIKDDLDFSLRESFQKSGSMHLLALSGLHVGMVVMLVSALLFWVQKRKLKIAITAVVACCYLFLAGPSPSLLRAVIMFAGAGLAYLVEREVRPVNILAFSACAVLLLAPEGVRTLSFALSYAALLGILTFGRKLHRWFSSRLPSRISALLSAALGAQLFTIAFVFSAFSEWYPAGIIASVILIPLVTVFFWAGLLFLPMTLLPIQAVRDTIPFLMNGLFWVLRFMTELFASIPGIHAEWQWWYWIVAAIFCMIAGSGIIETVIHELRKQKRNPPGP